MASRSRGRVLILTAATGNGHLAIANAIKKDLDSSYLPYLETRIVNPFVPEYCGCALNSFLGLYGPVVRRAPRLYSLFYNSMGIRGCSKLGMGLARWQMHPAFEELIASPLNRAIITTHAIFPQLIAPILPASRDFATIAVVTDLEVAEPVYCSPSIDRYLAMTEEVGRDLANQGVPLSRISVIGHIYDREAVGRARTQREETRRRLGVGPSEGLVVLSGGGDGAGALRQMVDSLQEAHAPAKLAVVCGANRRLYRRFTSSDRYRSVHVRGRARDFLELVAAADVLVTKAGAATMMEAVATGTSLVVVHNLPGQERHNAEYIQSHGYGVVASTVPCAVSAVQGALLARLATRQAEPRAIRRDIYPSSPLVQALTPELGPASYQEVFDSPGGDTGLARATSGIPSEGAKPLLTGSRRSGLFTQHRSAQVGYTE